jgi:hypothetical protein
MTRIIDHREDAEVSQEFFELRVFQLKDGDVRACLVLADPLVNLDMMAYLDALALCETENVTTLWVHDPLDLFPPHHRPEPGIVMNQLAPNRR